MGKIALSVILSALDGAVVAAPVPGRPDVEDTSIVQADGYRLLRETVVINAPRDAAWRAFATTDGLRGWEAPVVAIDLKVGGFLEDSYDPKAKLGDPGNIKNEILGFIPNELLVFRNVQAPADFKFASLLTHVTTIIQFEKLGPGSTRVTVSGVGYGIGPGFAELYGFFRAGNAYELELLKAYLEGRSPPAE